MRFFKAEIVAEDCKVRAYENAGHWREVEKKAILYPYEDYSDRTSADGDRKSSFRLPALKRTSTRTRS